MAVSTSEEFFALLEKSKLLDGRLLAEAQEAAADCHDAQDVARTLSRRELITRWQAGQLLAGRSAFFLGNYKLMELLGRAGMSNVFLGQHTTMNRQVALKIVARRIGNDPDALQRFLDEARLSAALEHPNIRRTYSVDSEADRYYMVMEYVDGVDLQTLVETEGPLDWHRAAAFIRQVADGLAHAHAKNIFHGPIMPSGVIVNRQDTVKLLDIGTARLTKRGEQQSALPDQHVPHPADYQAPEQAAADAKADQCSDIYSLGCTLYFLLTGRPPFGDGTIAERIARHRAEQPDAIAEQRGDVPTALVNICRKMMAKTPERRFQRAEEVGRALTQLLRTKREPKPAAPARRAAAVNAAGAPRPGKKPPVIAGETNISAVKGPHNAAAAPRRTAGKAMPAIQVGEDAGPAMSVAARRGLSAKKPLLGSSRQKWVIIGGSLLVALIALAVAIPLLLATGNNGGDDQQAQAATTGGAAQIDTPGKDPDDLLEESDSPSQQPANTDQPDHSGADEPPAETETETETTKTLPGETTETEEPPGETPEVPGPDQAGSDQPADPDPASTVIPGLQEQPEPEPEAEPEPDAEPGPDTQPEAEPEPEPPAKPEKPPTFRDFPKLINLPPPDDGRPVEIGTVHARVDAPWELSLSGGQSAGKPGQEFIIEGEEADHPASSWTVRHRKASRGSAGGKPTDVAKIYHEDGTLKFQWLTDAAGAPAGHLRNCVLSVSIDGESRPLFLLEPQQVEPIVVDLQRRMSPRVFEIDCLPDPSVLRLEITRLEGNFGQYKLDPTDPVEPKKQIGIGVFRLDRFGNEKLAVGLTLRMLSKRSGLSVEPQLKVPTAAVFAQCRLDENRKKIILDGRKKLEEQVKKQKGPMRNRFNAQLEQIDQGLWYGDFFNAVHNTGKIHFRVFVQADDQQIDLVRSEAAKK